MTTKQFNKLSKSRKAVLVAEDVLLQLKNKKYIANSGSYVNYDVNNALVEKNKDIKENFEEITNCYVCALGSMLMSCTHLGNMLTFQDLSPRSGGLNDHGETKVNHSKIQQLFSSIFNVKTLLRIEYAFEGENGDKYAERHFGENILYDEIIVLDKFARKYKTPKNRLIAICNNIIKNKGSFVL